MPRDTLDDSSENQIEAEVTVKWAIPGDINNLNFVGKDVFAVYDKLHIYFMNLNDGSESIYDAINSESGDGIQCFAGHRTASIFVFAEICKHPRLFLLTFPEFKVMRIVKDNNISAYADVGLTEMEQIVVLSGYPNYIITVWCWRTNKKLAMCETDVRSPNFFFRCSMAHSFIFHGWSKKFCFWELAPCFKTSLLLGRQLHGEIPKIIDLTWSPEGHLYCIDDDSIIYSIVSDGTGMIAIKEWSPEYSSCKPMITYYKGGLLICNQEFSITHMSKVNKEWTQNWKYSFDFPIVKMVSGGFGDSLLIVLITGKVLKLNYENNLVTFVNVTFWQRSIKFASALNPFGETIITANTENLICLWGTNGQLLSRTQLSNSITHMSCSPVAPLIAMCVGSSSGNGVCIVHAETNLRVTCASCLTEENLNHVIWSSSGNELIASSLTTGQIFFLKLKSPPFIVVINMINIKNKLVDCWTVFMGKDLYFMALALVMNVYTNIPEKVLICHNFLTSESVKTYGRIDPDMMKVLHLENNILLGLNTLPQEFQIFTMSLEEELLKINSENPIPLQHEISGISFNKDRGGVISWGLDGVVLYRPSIFKSKLKFKIKVKHHLDESIKFVVFDPQQRYAISLTHYGSMTVHNVSSNAVTPTKGGTGKINKASIPDLIEIEDVFKDCYETWVEECENLGKEQETAKWESQRNKLEGEFELLEEKLLVLLEENILAPPLHQLPLNIFNLHIDGQQQRAKEAAEERERVNIELGEIIKSQDAVTLWIKTNCWDNMDVIGKELHAIFTSEFVENYPLPSMKSSQNVHKITEYYRSIENKKDNVFKPWVTIDSDSSIVKQTSSDKVGMSVDISYQDDNVDVEPDKRKTDEVFLHQLTGSSVHVFITPEFYSYPQMLLQSNLQMRWQTNMIEQNINKTKLWFNKQFDEMMLCKQKELSMIEEKDKRLNVIISELNTLYSLKESEKRINIYIRDPQWMQEEIPSKLITVEENEVGVTPYISPSQVVIPPPDLGPKDDFKERALMYMMDGVLEKLWHEEIKKPILKPLCMQIKEPDEYTEDDLKVIHEWEKSVEFRNEEREQYRKMLRAEYLKLSSSLNEMINRFNQKIKDFYLLKLKVESAVGQEDLKLMRLRVNHLQRIERVETIKKLELQLLNNEVELDKALKEFQEIQNQSTDCHTAYEAYLTRDKTLDKNFKINFSDVSPIVADICYKLFKKRPKWQQRASMTAGVLYEMAHACLSKERPPLLHPDCNDYLKGLDQLDSSSSMPPVMDETVWITMCKLRRVKVDNEIKIRAICVEIAEVESTSNTWQKRITTMKNICQKIRNEINNYRHEIEFSSRNVSIQLVMKSGFVEIDLTGHEEDFDAAVLLKDNDIDAINKKILEAGQLKLKALRATTSFKKNILSMEWEHAKLKMKIRHLEEDLYHLERIKVTKEVRKYLQNKTKKNIIGNNVEVERQIEITRLSFDNQLYSYIHYVEELEMKLDALKVQIEKTDNFISKIKVRVSEKHHAEDPAALEKKMRVQSSRMNILVLRSRLLEEVQKQYVAIVLLQTELELQRLRTYPTLSAIQKGERDDLHQFPQIPTEQ